MKRNLLLTTVAVTILAFGCQKSDEESGEIRPEGVDVEAVDDNPDRETVIGRQLPNPYSVSNMRCAYRELSAQTRSVVDEQEIVATHLYVKFMPSSYTELNSLQIQTDLDAYLVPLDCEFTDGWSNDVDPENSTNGFQYRWCAVPVERDLSNINCPYEILEELYIPDDFDEQGENLTKSLADLPESFVDELVKKSYELCGLELTPVAAETRASYVYPSGNITAWDSSLGRYVGNEGMKVKAVRGFKTSTGFCDATGYFKCNKSFKYSWAYHMYFGRDDFEVREGDETNEIVYNKYDMHSAWTYVFGPNTNESAWSAMFRAAFRYYYRPITTRRPPMNGTWDAKLAIQAYDSNNGTILGRMNEKGRFVLSPRPMIHIWCKNENNAYYKSDEMYGTAIHELAHAAHRCLDTDSYDNASKIVKESYSTGVEGELTREVYPDYFIDYIRGRYTGMIRDMMDEKTDSLTKVEIIKSIDEQDNRHDGIKSYEDLASGYTLRELEDALIYTTTWDQWKNRIKNKYPDKPSRQYVDSVFIFWGD